MRKLPQCPPTQYCMLSLGVSLNKNFQKMPHFQCSHSRQFSHLRLAGLQTVPTTKCHDAVELLTATRHHTAKELE